MKFQMTLLRRFAGVFWAAAITMIVWSHFAHAEHGLCCVLDHGTEHQTDSGDCPAGHACSHSHTQGVIGLSETLSVSGVLGVTDFAGGSDSSWPEGTPRKIDHPPQLS